MLKLILIILVLSALFYIVYINDNDQHFLLRTYLLSTLALLFIGIIVKYIKMPINIFALLASLYVIFFAVQFINTSNVYIRNIFGILLLIALAYLVQIAMNQTTYDITTGILVTSILLLLINIVASNISTESLYKITQWSQWLNTFFFISLMFFAFNYGFYTNLISIVFAGLFLFSLFIRVAKLYLINKTENTSNHTLMSYGLVNDLLFLFGNVIRLF